MDDEDDFDSVFGEGSILSSTASLSKSILEYRHLHGRTYQVSASTVYWGPNDSKQLEGLDMAHHWVTLLLDNKLCLAPIGNNVQRVLDIGTGTGIWAIDFADTHPSAEVIGTDISPVQPSWVPPNCRFILEDAQLDWTYPPDHFDFIHVRFNVGCIDDWKKLYRQAFACVKPGGYFQHCEYDILSRSDAEPIGPDHVYRRWFQLLCEAGEITGRQMRYPIIDGKMKDLMEETGFVDVVQKCWKIPIGGWHSEKKMKQIGFFTLEYVDSSLEGFALFLLKEILGWEYEQIQEIVATMRNALHRRKLRPYFLLYLTYGRKPS